MLNKKSVILTCLLGFCLLNLFAFVLSYYRLDRIPYGYHVDELSGSVDIGCLTTEGIDAHNVPYPLFSSLNYGTPKPPTYLYPAILWARVFGYSVASLRALSVTVHLFGIIGLLFLARSFFGWHYALLTMTVASISPWTWNLSRVGFESLFSATFLIWGLYFFFRSHKVRDIVLSGLFFAAAIYSYPPFRLQMPLMLLSLVIYSCWKNPRGLKSWIVFAIALIIPVIPLIQKTLSGEIQQRFNGISILSKDYLNSIHSSGNFFDIILIFMNNYLMHLNPDFLFLRGDPSYVHSTRHFGILSWLDMLALFLTLIWFFMLLVKKFRKDNPLSFQGPFILFLISNILLGVIPAAMTNSELPNSLRITGGWPFMCLFSGYILWQACERWWALWIGTLLLAVCFAAVFFNVYFKIFPQEGKGMFSYWTLDQADQIRSDEDWMKFVMLYRYQDYNARYFLMQYRHLSCTQSKNVWDGMNDFLKKQGKP